MIEKIILHNFQIHRNVTLDLGRSTVLLGDSNSGKTAVLRALYWVLYNTPSGDSYVSYWAKKGNKFRDDAYTSVTVVIDGHTIERKRSNSFNGYIVDGDVYEALRTAVPEKVTEIFNLAEASVQRQMDAPFLLSATPGEASQYLNNLAGLGCVDDILTIAKKKCSETSSQVDSLNDDISELNKEIKTYNWLEKAEELYNKANDLEPKIQESIRMLDALNKDIQDYMNIKTYPEIPNWLDDIDLRPKIKSLNETLELVDRYITASKTIDRIEPILQDIDNLKIPKESKYSEKDLSVLTSTIKEFRLASGNLRIYSDTLDDIHNLEVPKENKWDDNDLETLIRTTKEYSLCDETINNCTESLELLYKSLIGVACPTCGRPMDEKHCIL